jgi:hypothetical protein
MHLDWLPRRRKNFPSAIMLCKVYVSLVSVLRAVFFVCVVPELLFISFQSLTCATQWSFLSLPICTMSIFLCAYIYIVHETVLHILWGSFFLFLKCSLWPWAFHGLMLFFSPCFLIFNFLLCIVCCPLLNFQCLPSLPTTFWTLCLRGTNNSLVPPVQSTIFLFINDLCRYWFLPPILLTCSVVYVLLIWCGFTCFSLSLWIY